MNDRQIPPAIRPLLPILSAAALSLLSIAAAEAQRGDFYIGANYGIADVEVRSSGAYDQIVDGEENALSYEIGYRFNPNIGLEAGYHDLSKVDGTILPCAEDSSCSKKDTKTDFTALTLALVPSYQITGRVLLFAKVGLVSWEGDIDGADADLDIALDDLDSGDTLLGVGVQVSLIAGLDVVTQWQSFSDIEILSAGLRLTF